MDMLMEIPRNWIVPAMALSAAATLDRAAAVNFDRILAGFSARNP
jgi:Skp family chaperone for outer membrane proteins